MCWVLSYEIKTWINMFKFICGLTHFKKCLYIGLGVRVFANGLGDLGSIPGRVIPKTQKMVLDASLLSTQHYKVRIKGKVEQSRKWVAPSPTHWCSSYRKGSLRVTLDYGRQLTYIHIYFNVDWVSILSRSHSLYHLKVLETLYALYLQPFLCKQRDCLLGLNVISLLSSAHLSYSPPHFFFSFFLSSSFSPLHSPF